jgi:hypothetical protein
MFVSYITHNEEFDICQIETVASKTATLFLHTLGAIMENDKLDNLLYNYLRPNSKLLAIKQSINTY